MRRLTVDPDAARALRLTLARCRSEGIGAVVILMPEAGWYRELLPAVAAAEVMALADKLGREFAAPVVDARSSPPVPLSRRRTAS